MSGDHSGFVAPSAADLAQTTALYSRHLFLQAKMTEYAGWLLPVQYAGIAAEHLAVRQRAGLFDVSHMGEILVSGREAAAFLNFLLPRDLSRIKPGQACYSPMCLPSGGTVDDLIVHPLDESRFLLVVNAANSAKDFEHIRACARQFPGVAVENLSSAYAQLALQGPDAAAILTRLGQKQKDGLAAWQDLPDLGQAVALRPYHFIYQEGPAGAGSMISRTGYTGEDGFEIYLEPAQADRTWQLLQEEGAVPCGLGARDSLRLEAGMPLYGHELGPDISPLEAGLQRFVALEKPEPGFIGQQALRLSLQPSPPSGALAGLRRLIGLRSAGRAIPRAGYPVLAGGRTVGQVTSGVYSPTFSQGIAIALVDTAADLESSEISVLVRDRQEPFMLNPLPFYKKPAK
ncbi:MAG TPA: glycine cleavage system aminomethyltransferase GcvT [Clostridiales bacterium]|nr:glycine cleavage system aminomethyltransferase GcvT [Clostridiales bacterium]